MRKIEKINREKRFARCEGTPSQLVLFDTGDKVLAAQVPRQQMLAATIYIDDMGNRESFLIEPAMYVQALIEGGAIKIVKGKVVVQPHEGMEAEPETPPEKAEHKWRRWRGHKLKSQSNPPKSAEEGCENVQVWLRDGTISDGSPHDYVWNIDCGPYDIIKWRPYDGDEA